MSCPAGGESEQAVSVLRRFLEAHPGAEGVEIALAKIYLGSDRRSEGLAVLEPVLQRNPTHPVTLELVREFR